MTHPRQRAAQPPSLFRFQLHLTKNFAGFSLVEKSHDDSGILALQNGRETVLSVSGMPEGLSQALTAVIS